MKSLMLRLTGIAAIFALLCVGCKDNGTNQKPEEKGPYKLTVGVGGDSGGGDVSHSPVKDDYDVDDTIVVTATAKENYAFASWSGVGKDDIISGENTARLTIRMTKGDKAIIANFKRTHFNLTINIDPSDKNWGGIDTAKSEAGTEPLAYNGGKYKVPVDDNGKAQAKLYIKKQTGYDFAGWTWFDDSTSSVDSLILDNISSDMTVTAKFKEAPSYTTHYRITIGVTPTGGGTITLQDSTYSVFGTFPPSKWITRGEDSEVKAESNKGFKFVDWTVNGIDTDDMNLESTTLLIKDDGQANEIQIIANFEQED